MLSPGSPAFRNGRPVLSVNRTDPPGHFTIPGGFSVHDGANGVRGNVPAPHGAVDMIAAAGTPFPMGRPYEILGSHRQAAPRNGRDGGNIALVRVEGAGTWKAMHLPSLPPAGRYEAGPSMVLRAGHTGSRNSAMIHWQPADDTARAILRQGRRAVVEALTGNRR